jgi:hypothetical protein
MNDDSIFGRLYRNNFARATAFTLATVLGGGAVLVNQSAYGQANTTTDTSASSTTGTDTAVTSTTATDSTGTTGTDTTGTGVTSTDTTGTGAPTTTDTTGTQGTNPPAPNAPAPNAPPAPVVETIKPEYAHPAHKHDHSRVHGRHLDGLKVVYEIPNADHDPADPNSPELSSVRVDTFSSRQPRKWKDANGVEHKLRWHKPTYEKDAKQYMDTQNVPVKGVFATVRNPGEKHAAVTMPVYNFTGGNMQLILANPRGDVRETVAYLPETYKGETMNSPRVINRFGDGQVTAQDLIDLKDEATKTTDADGKDQYTLKVFVMQEGLNKNGVVIEAEPVAMAFCYNDDLTASTTEIPSYDMNASAAETRFYNAQSAPQVAQAPAKPAAVAEAPKPRPTARLARAAPKKSELSDRVVTPVAQTPVAAPVAEPQTGTFDEFTAYAPDSAAVKPTQNAQNVGSYSGPGLFASFLTPRGMPGPTTYAINAQQNVTVDNGSVVTTTFDTSSATNTLGVRGDYQQLMSDMAKDLVKTQERTTYTLDHK